MKPNETELLDRLATTRPDGRSGGRIGAQGGERDAVRRVVRRSYVETLREALVRALEEGYAGADVVHLEAEGLSPRSRSDVWQVRKWTESPPTSPREHRLRYDFRYYDRERLVTALEDGGDRSSVTTPTRRADAADGTGDTRDDS